VGALRPQGEVLPAERHDRGLGVVPGPLRDDVGVQARADDQPVEGERLAVAPALGADLDRAVALPDPVDPQPQPHPPAARGQVPGVLLRDRDEVRDRRPRGVQRGHPGRVRLDLAQPVPSSRRRSGTPFASARCRICSSAASSEPSTATTTLPHSSYGRPRSAQYSFSIEEPRRHSRAFSDPGG
jgi:hypothetical protein